MEHNAYPPIWHRFPATFLYGFHKYPIGLAVAIGLLFALLQPGFIITISLFFMIAKYGVEAFRPTARGELDPPPLSAEVLLNDYKPAAQIYAMMLLPGILTGIIAASISPFLGMIAGYFFLIALPACFMVLMMTESMLQALNPVMLIQMMTRMGWSYAILYGLLFILSTAWGNLSMLVIRIENPFLLIFGMYTLMIYFAIVSAHMMGYMVLQEAEALGGESPNAPKEDGRLALFEDLLREGNNNAARLELADVIGRHPEDLELQRRLHNLALADQAGKDLLKNARGYIPRLLDAGKAREAADVYLDCARLVPETPLQVSSQHTCKLARALREKGASKPAFLLLKGFHKTFPDSSHTPEAYLLGARILVEDLNRDDLAKQLLQYLLQAYPEHERREEVRGYLRTISALGSG